MDRHQSSLGRKSSAESHMRVSRHPQQASEEAKSSWSGRQKGEYEKKSKLLRIHAQCLF